jgi:hypothetical protein
MVTVDQERNTLSRGTVVKIKDSTSAFNGNFGEIRSLFRDTLFLWVKNPRL